MFVRPLSKKLLAMGAALATSAVTMPAWANRPVDGELGLQPPATPLAEQVAFFHNSVLMPIIVVITLFVLALLIVVVLKFNSKSNPTPSKRSHNLMIEIVWTVVPILILGYIAIFSFDLLWQEDVIPDGKRTVCEGDGQLTECSFDNDFVKSRSITSKRYVDVFKWVGGEKTKLTYKKDYKLNGLGKDVVTVALTSAPAVGENIEVIAGRSRVGVTKFFGFGEDRSSIVPAPSVTIKAQARQWGWDYFYPDHGNFEFAANLQQKADLSDPSLYLLEATNHIVVPEGETVRLLVTSIDVIHAWAMPSFGVKIDAVPGRTNETWFAAPTPGMYYGQCSEICGVDHAYMPISLEVKTKEDFEKWVDEQRAFAELEPMFDTKNDVRFAAAADDAALQE